MLGASWGYQRIASPTATRNLALTTRRRRCGTLVPTRIQTRATFSTQNDSEAASTSYCLHLEHFLSHRLQRLGMAAFTVTKEYPATCPTATISFWATTVTTVTTAGCGALCQRLIS